MKRLSILTVAVGFCLLLLGAVTAQEREDLTLLNWDQMRAIINETSSERAFAGKKEFLFNH